MDPISKILNDPRKSALIGAATGAVKGVVVGAVVGKVVVLTLLGAAGGAAAGAGLSWLNSRRPVVPVPREQEGLI